MRGCPWVSAVANLEEGCTGTEINGESNNRCLGFTKPPRLKRDDLVVEKFDTDVNGIMGNGRSLQ